MSSTLDRLSYKDRYEVHKMASTQISFTAPKLKKYLIKGEPNNHGMFTLRKTNGEVIVLPFREVHCYDNGVDEFMNGQLEEIK